MDWTKDKLLGIHSSEPHNPVIAKTFHKAGYVESWGRGIEKIFDACAAYGIPNPEYEVLGSMVTVYFTNPDLAKKTSEKTSKETRVETRVETREKIVNLIKDNPQITSVEISKRIGISLKGVEWQLKRIRDLKKIMHIGSRKGGYWKIVD